MKKLSIVLLIVLAGAAGVWAVGGPEQAGRTPQNRVQAPAAPRMSDIQAAVNAGKAALLDVRTKAEYDSGHVPGAVNLDNQDIQAGALPAVEKNIPLYVYCRSGNRSAQAAATLQRAGYQAVTDLGGLSDVEALGARLSR